VAESSLEILWQVPARPRQELAVAPAVPIAEKCWLHLYHQTTAGILQQSSSIFETAPLDEGVIDS